MSAILIKNVPSSLHNRIKKLAVQHHRSLNKEALVLLETALAGEDLKRTDLPPLFQGKFPLTDDFISRAKTEGRD